MASVVDYFAGLGPLEENANSVQEAAKELETKTSANLQIAEEVRANVMSSIMKYNTEIARIDTLQQQLESKEFEKQAQVEQLQKQLDEQRQEQLDLKNANAQFQLLLQVKNENAAKEMDTLKNQVSELEERNRSLVEAYQRYSEFEERMSSSLLGTLGTFEKVLENVQKTNEVESAALDMLKNPETVGTTKDAPTRTRSSSFKSKTPKTPKTPTLA
jgi:chromosome segregation ATPase